MRNVAPALLLLLLAACAASPPAPPPEEPLFADHLFGPPSQPVDASRVLAVSEPMRRYLAQDIGQLTGIKGRQRALVDALRREGGIKLHYDTAFTRTASEAFDARAGNCLSLVIMTAALARELGAGVRFQSVYVDDTLNRSGDVQFFVGHVNLSLGRRPPETGSNIDDGEQLTIDFLPPPDLRGIKWRVIEERTVLAMYMNNRAAESIVDGRVDDAYWFAREAVRQDPAFASAINTLGVVYRRKGRSAEAAVAFTRALEQDRNNTRTLSNYAATLASLGRSAEAEAVRVRIAELEPEPQFSLFEKGLAAMRAGDYAAARELFQREVTRTPTYHEFHYWLAAALTRLGKDSEARHHMALAKDLSGTRQDADRYSSKLSRLKQAGRLPASRQPES
jgi:Flp pilus assembly protein TadD